MKQERLQEIIDFAHEAKQAGIPAGDVLIEMIDAYIQAKTQTRGGIDKLASLCDQWDVRSAEALQRFYDQKQGERNKALYENSCVYQECARELRETFVR